MVGHGGDIARAARLTGIPERRILDFSASINPLGMPQAAERAIRRQTGRLDHYPDPFCEGLAGMIARKIGVSPNAVICGNGSTELIYLVPRALRPERVLMPCPTFSEYERACRTAGDPEIVFLKLKRRDSFRIDADGFIEAMSGCVRGGGKSLAFLCNPNNPTAGLVPKDEMRAIAEAAKRLRCRLVVDEAFIDYCPGSSLVREAAGNPYLIVLRSLTKFYGLAGLRLGYGVFHPSISELIRQKQEPWTVNSLAQAAGAVLLSDAAYRKRSLRTMAAEKVFMEQGFSRLGISFLPSSANYYLLRLKNAQRVIGSLAKKGILVRDCSNFRGLDATYIRVAVRSRRENARLLREMRSLCADS
ncbi:MAG: histidinol-phosphate transaminase [Thermodesulfovibrionales bacterium]